MTKFESGLGAAMTLALAVLSQSLACGAVEPPAGAGGSAAAGAAAGSGGSGGGGSQTGGLGGAGTGGAAGAPAGTGGRGGAGAAGSGGAGGAVVLPGGAIATDPGLKVAFIGDTGAGVGFENVLKLIKTEGSHFVVHNGDALYGGDTGPAFWAMVDKVLGHNYPYFFAQGNHDDDMWALGLPQHLQEHASGQPGIQIDWSTFTDRAGSKHHIVYRGLSMVFLGVGKHAGGFDAYLKQKLAGTKHIWKVCSWHELQTNMQVGGKADDVGWEGYETCRDQGAIIQTAHEHSYHRTKTLTSVVNQAVDPMCADPKKVCVGPGRSFVTVTGLGGNNWREQVRCFPSTYPYGCKNEWASIYTSNQGADFGAQFIIFNHNGNPRAAHGYFKNIKGQIIDEFDIATP